MFSLTLRIIEKYNLVKDALILDTVLCRTLTKEIGAKNTIKKGT